MEVWQRDHIRVNLPNLIKTTMCNEMFLSHLYAAKLISSEEVDILKHIRNGQEKTGKLYDIIQTRTQSYNLLKTALRETNQTGAYDILHNYKTQFKVYGSVSYCRAMLIGRGSYGTMVYRGRFDNLDVAVKMINADYVDLRRAHKEVQFMKDLGSHANIVRYHKTEETDDFVFIALELCDTNLHDWVTKAHSRMHQTADGVMNILSQLTTGIDYLHSRKVVHRDLKPANILLIFPEGEKLQVKISDFGVSKKIPDVNSVYMAHTSGVGTEGWRSPEVIRSLMQETSDNAVIRVGYSSDIFSLGCIFYFVLTRPHGIHPFGDAVHRQVNILNGKMELAEGKITTKGVKASELMKLITKMIAHSYSERPIASVILTQLSNLGNTVNTSIVATSGKGLAETKLTYKPEDISHLTTEAGRIFPKPPSSQVSVNVASSPARVGVLSAEKRLNERQSGEDNQVQRSTVNDLVKKFSLNLDDQKPLTPDQSTSKCPQDSNLNSSSPAGNREEPKTDLVTEFGSCLQSYEAYSSDELSFSKGDIIAITSKPKGQVPGDGWRYGRIRGQIGFFPSDYMTIISPQEVFQEIMTNPTYNDPAVLEELFNMGIGIDADLHLAVERQNMKLIQGLVKKGHINLNATNDIKFTPLHSAVFGRDSKLTLRIIQYLIDQGADAFARDIEEQTFLHILVQGLTPTQFHNITLYLVAKGLTELFNAPDERSATPFHLSVRYVSIKIETSAILFKNGVDINAVDKLGNSVLFYYVVQSRFRVEFISDLIRFGGNYKHSNNKKQTLLHITANLGNVDACRFALDLGLDVNAVDINGNTPLHTVLKTREENVVELTRLLMEKGANANICDEEGKSSYALAHDMFPFSEWSAVELLNSMLN